MAISKVKRVCGAAHGVAGYVALLLCAAACGASDSAESEDRRAPSGAMAANPAGSSSGNSGGIAGSGSQFGNADPRLGSGGSAVPHGAGGASGSASESCARGMATATPVTPTIWLVVDGSSSMEMEFAAGSSRWQTLRSTLMDPGGVVETLAPAARIGIVIYSGAVDLLGMCPNLITVQPELNNYSAINNAYPINSVAMNTPTAEAMDYVVSNLPVVNMDQLDRDPQPIYVVLATDGQPNGCMGQGGGGNDAEQNVIDVVTRGTQNGMNMFVISLAGGDDRLQSHLEQVAQATQTKTPPFVPATQADLVATFEAIIGGATCQVALNGMVKEDKACSGTVALNGNALACESDDGWRLTDPRTVQLTGNACESFKANNSQVIADFPCEAFSPD